jgi:hypothetical protein
MKQPACLLFLLLCFPGIHFGQKKTSKSPPPPVFDIVQAMDQKLLSVSIESTGGCQGESLKMICRNVSGRPFHLQVQQGLLMKPADTTMQVLVVSQSREIPVPTKTDIEIKLTTFCTQAGRRTPASGTVFSLGALAPDRVCQLLKFLTDQHKLESADAQYAIWCVTSRDRLAGISDPEIKKFTSNLIGKEPPEYHVTYEIQDNPGSMADFGKAMVLDSKFQYTLQKDERLSLILYNSDNQVVKVLRKDELAKAGEHRSGIHLEVWTLESGKYYVRLQTKNGVVIKEMEVTF